MTSTLQGALWVGAGAIGGAWARYALSLVLNPLLPGLPLGTLAANLAGGFLAGMALALAFHARPLAPEMQLLLVTGFLGALTTFSSFSAEAIALLLRQHYAWFALHVGAHVAGSLAATLAGFGLIRLLMRS